MPGNWSPDATLHTMLNLDKFDYRNLWNDYMTVGCLINYKYKCIKNGVSVQTMNGNNILAMHPVCSNSRRSRTNEIGNFSYFIEKSYQLWNDNIFLFKRDRL